MQSKAMAPPDEAGAKGRPLSAGGDLSHMLMSSSRCSTRFNLFSSLSTAPMQLYQYINISKQECHLYRKQGLDPCQEALSLFLVCSVVAPHASEDLLSLSNYVALALKFSFNSSPELEATVPFVAGARGRPLPAGGQALSPQQGLSRGTSLQRTFALCLTNIPPMFPPNLILISEEKKCHWPWQSFLKFLSNHHSNQLQKIFICAACNQGRSGF